MSKPLIITDLDGTLIDTQALNVFAYAEALRTNGFTPDEAVLETGLRNGKKFHEFLPQMGISSAQDMAIVHKSKKEIYRANMQKAAPIAPVVGLLSSLRGTHTLALYSTSSKVNGGAMLEHLGLASWFEIMLFEDDIQALGLASKPAPDGYLHIMKHFGVEPPATLILEDSVTGLEAARRSGAHVLQVRQPV